MNVYLASGFHHRVKLRSMAYDLLLKGHTPVSRWIWIEERPERTDRYYHVFATKIAQDNLKDLEAADVLVIDADGISESNHGGVHTELGYFLAKGKPIYLIGRRSNTFHWADAVKKTTWHDALEDMSLAGTTGKDKHGMGISWRNY